jgi:hypothetical protein
MCSRDDHPPYAKAVAYTNLTSEDYVMADPVESVRAGMTDPPYWAVILPSGAVTLVHGRPTYQDINRAVGGYIEMVPHDAPEAQTLTAYCNEYGKLDRLPVNMTATRFLRMRGDILCGPVVLIGGPDDEGEDTALPADTRMRLVTEVIEG